MGAYECEENELPEIFNRSEFSSIQKLELVNTTNIVSSCKGGPSSEFWDRANLPFRGGGYQYLQQVLRGRGWQK